MTTDKSNEVTITSRLANKNILITGVATAQEFDKQGARVAICGLNEGTLQATKKTLGSRKSHRSR